MAAGIATDALAFVEEFPKLRRGLAHVLGQDFG
jgi:hypothetical protein